MEQSEGNCLAKAMNQSEAAINSLVKVQMEQSKVLKKLTKVLTRLGSHRDADCYDLISNTNKNTPKMSILDFASYFQVPQQELVCMVSGQRVPTLARILPRSANMITLKSVHEIGRCRRRGEYAFAL